MQKALFLIMISVLAAISTSYAFSQEMNLATFQETAQVIVDKSGSQNVTASITLQSTSIQEIKFPAELEQRIRENESITAVIVTNQDMCVPGVSNESCIMINVKRDPADKDFAAIQNSTKSISGQFIDDINKAFDTNAKLHSTYIHGSDEANVALDTSGVISGKGTISAVYTMPMEDTSSMYEKLSALLIPKVIRDAGGFYSAAQNLSSQENSKMTFSVIPAGNKSLLQLRLSVNYPHVAPTVNEVKPLEFLKTDKLERSGYFSDGFYPLNSILQVVVLSDSKTSVSDVRGDIVPSQTVEGEKIPTDVTSPGWIFDPDQGTRIQGKYIFGKTTSVTGDEVTFSLGDGQPAPPKESKTPMDESIAVVVIITIIAIAAAVFYLKGYKR